MVADLKDFEAFGLYYGDEILERMQNVGPIGGLLQVAAEQTEPVKLLPIVRAWAGAGGTITAETLDFLTERLIEGLKKSLPVDAIFLALHGAAASEKEDDVEGHLLSRRPRMRRRSHPGRRLPRSPCQYHATDGAMCERADRP